MKDINPKAVLIAIAGGVLAALAVAAPIVDDGVTASEIIAISSAFIAGTGLTGASTPSVRRKVGE